MTTTVCDIANKILTTDSRWSWETESAVLYVDDVRFEKMIYMKDTVYQFAGNSRVIQEWKDFVAADPKSAAERPTLDGISLMMYDVNANAVLLAHNCCCGNDEDQRTISIFSGTGMVHALPAWAVHRCAYKALEHAVSMDPFSGGTTKFFELNDCRHNLMEEVRVLDINRALPLKGYVMTKSHNESKLGDPIPAAEAAANDADIRSVVEQIAEGKLAPSAPFMYMHCKATDEQNKVADAALNALFSR
ncbi:MAG: hypothetical protein ACRESJ_00770 [Pseudomonas sp.]|uniref:hypothetical protein n=1 Tax=Pseudomonas sp. TaxID=306 RepID=UPI003D6F8C5E